MIYTYLNIPKYITSFQATFNIENGAFHLCISRGVINGSRASLRLHSTSLPSPLPFATTMKVCSELNYIPFQAQLT